MEEELKRLEQEAGTALQEITDATGLEPFRVKYLGRKGLFSTVMRQLGQVPKEERPRIGQLANQYRRAVGVAPQYREELRSALERVKTGGGVPVVDVIEQINREVHTNGFS